MKRAAFKQKHHKFVVFNLILGIVANSNQKGFNGHQYEMEIGEIVTKCLIKPTNQP